MKPQPQPNRKPIQKVIPKLKVVSDKRRKFLDLIEDRMEKALARIRIVGQLFNTHNYEWMESEADKIIETLEQAVANVKLKANKKSKDTRDTFKL
jgi:hypothetical protein